MSGEPEVAADLQLASTLADGADAITLARFGALDLRVDTKPDLSPVTDADEAVETQIRATLARDRPDDAIFGEEQGGTPVLGGRQWVIDPIDGTKNFVRGVPVWASLIALLQDGVPVVGMVSAPALKRRWWAGRGLGAHTSFADCTPRRIAVSGVADLSAASLSFSDLTGWAERGLREQFLALLNAVWRVRAYGDFFSYCLLAEGAVDVAAEPEVKLGDLGALDVLVREAGGMFTNLDGRPGPHGGSAVASNGLLHPAVLAALSCEVSNRVD